MKCWSDWIRIAPSCSESAAGEEPGGFGKFIFGRDGPRLAEIVRDWPSQGELMEDCNSGCLWLCRAGLARAGDAGDVEWGPGGNVPPVVEIGGGSPADHQ